MRWTEYAVAMLLYSVVSMIVLYLLQRLQGYLPFNPQHLPGVDSATYAAGGYVGSSFNTAASFTTNTNWQGYGGEVTMSYLTQMAGLAYHNFTSAAVGMGLAIAFIRGIARREMETIGNFWVDHGTRLPLDSAAALHRAGARAGLAGRGAEPQALRHGAVG